mmetsp:Transcript_16492/g.42058  ORF Transcript_16492/g.42058 Transcript_16492/m.42058 type:complete len:285 (+) Transcript_16492:318-1172(+)
MLSPPPPLEAVSSQSRTVSKGWLGGKNAGAAVVVPELELTPSLELAGGARSRLWRDCTRGFGEGNIFARASRALFSLSPQVTFASSVPQCAKLEAEGGETRTLEKVGRAMLARSAGPPRHSSAGERARTLSSIFGGLPLPPLLLPLALLLGRAKRTPAWDSISRSLASTVRSANSSMSRRQSISPSVSGSNHICERLRHAPVATAKSASAAFESKPTRPLAPGPHTPRSDAGDDSDGAAAVGSFSESAKGAKPGRSAAWGASALWRADISLASALRASSVPTKS